MNRLSDFRTINLLVNNEDVSISRIKRFSDDKTFIYKTTPNMIIDSNIMYDYQEEYDKMEKLNGRGCLIPCELNMSLERPSILFHDFKGITLQKLILSRRKQLSLNEQLEVAVAVILCVHHIHTKGMYMNVLTPTDIMIGDDLKEAKLLNITTTNRVGRSPIFSESSFRINELVQYIAPELARKIIVEPTIQSDIYSLGIILYEWFAMTLPFGSLSTVDNTYSHIATMPKPISELNDNIPEIISNIVMKCLEKKPENRYTTTFSLYCDVEECLLKLQQEHLLDAFPLAKQDLLKGYIREGTLLARKNEQQQFKQVLRNYVEMKIKAVTVSGLAHIGKSYFVNHTLNNNQYKYYKVSIACDETNINEDYSVLTSIVSQMLDIMLTYNSEQLEDWKKSTIKELGNNIPFLENITPKLKLLFGEGYEYAFENEQDNNNITIFITKLFEQVIQQLTHIVVFLDNTHFIDRQSLQFIQQQLETSTYNHLLFVIAYRSESSYKLFQQWIQTTNKERFVYPLTLQSIQYDELLSELRPLLFEGVHNIDEFILLLIDKTEGYAGELCLFVQHLINKNLLFYNSGNRCWEWKVDEIKEISLQDNVVSSKLEIIEDKSDISKQILAIAAIIGHEFDLNLLSQFINISPEQLCSYLEEAVAQKVLFKKSTANAEFIFQHQKLREFCLDFLTEDEKEAIYFKLGKSLLLQKLEGEHISAIGILNYWNKVAHLNHNPVYSKEIIELNIEAGLELKQNQKFQDALKYLQQATCLLEDKDWELYYELTHRAFIERAKLEFLCLDYVKANDILETILKKAKTDLEKAEVILEIIQIEMGKDRYSETVKLCERALLLLNIKTEQQLNKFKLLRLYVKVKGSLKVHNIESMISHFKMTDKRQLTVMRIMTHYADAIYPINKEKWFYMTLKMIEKTVKEGISEEAAIAFCNYALVLNHKFFDYPSSYKWGLLAYELSKSNPQINIRTYSTFIICYDSWRNYDPHFLNKNIGEVTQVASRIGDVWNGNYALIISCAVFFHLGHPLKDIYVRLLSQAAQLQEDKTTLLWTYAVILANVIKQLTGYTSVNDSFPSLNVDDIYDITMRHSNDDTSKQIIILYYKCKYIIDYIKGEYEEAFFAWKKCVDISVSDKNEALEDINDYVFYVLIIRDIFFYKTKLEQKKIIKTIDSYIKKVKNKAKKSPSNYLHKYFLLQAVKASLIYKNRQAERYYEQALTEAYNNGFIHDVAIIAESYAKYGLRLGKMSLARLYMSEAYDAYSRWGAFSIASQLENKYSYLFSSTGTLQSGRTDYSSIVKATQAISMEMEKEKLLFTIMEIMIKNAGGQYGAFILIQDDSEVVEVYGQADQLQIANINLEEAKNILPVPLIRYAIKTKEEVVIHEIKNNDLFSSMLPQQGSNAQSILCLPILNQNKLIGVLYLENNIAGGIFTKERIEVLKLLGTQCAISIKNAELFSGLEDLKNNLENQVEQRTKDFERSMQATSEALSDSIVYAERTRIAQEIHDIVGHTLTSTILQIEAGKRLMDKDMNQSLSSFQEAQNLVRHSLNEIRNSVHMLREDKYYDIFNALRQLVKETEQNTGVLIYTNVDESITLSLMQKKALYHALQEGLTNGIKHGRSTEFHFSLYQENSSICMLLGDNGIGTDQNTQGFGLKMMRERIEQLSGNLHIISEPNHGYLLRIQLPYK